jgi:uncharacterized protein YcsI (UPF0317 family)
MGPELLPLPLLLDHRNLIARWHGAPYFYESSGPLPFRQQVRAGLLLRSDERPVPRLPQCNLVVLKKEWAFDFVILPEKPQVMSSH